MKFKYRNHVVTINDKVVEEFTKKIEPTITQSLFDMYAEQYFAKDDEEIEDIDFSKYTDKQLSEQFEECMAEECLVLSEVRAAWKKELGK